MTPNPSPEARIRPEIVPAPPREQAIAAFKTEAPRYAGGSRVPGWDDPVDLTKDPATIPDPATTAVPAELRAEIEDLMTRYPDPKSASIPALAAAQRLHGWCSPEAIEQVACVMQAHARLPHRGRDLLRHARHEARRPVPASTCARTSRCSLHGADELLDAVKGELREGDDIHVRGFECLGACDIAPMASIDGVYVGPIALDEVPTLVDQIRKGEDPLPDKQLNKRRSADPEANG